MCGLAGFLGPSLSEGEAYGILNNMSASLVHRGPDQAGAYYDKFTGIGLAHQRLAIHDLSENGQQPFVSSSGRWVLAFNGEIYNFQSLRQALQGPALGDWRSKTDTEVLVELVERYGPAEALTRTRGMFAVAIWDRRDEALYLARDRMGEKPIYYSLINGFCVFGSELQSLMKHPKMSARVNREALALQLERNCVPGSLSILEGVHKVSPATIVKISCNKGLRVEEVTPFWWFPSVEEGRQRTPSTVAEVKDALGSAVGDMLSADVPIGAFLSGGIDSSLIAALMQENSNQRIKTFTIGFENRKFDESHHAASVARALGTEHHELRVSDSDILDVVPHLASIYDEPFSDSSQIPTVILSNLTRRHVTVCLSGDGADELFGGYTRYNQAKKYWRAIEKCPSAIRQAFSKGIGAIPESVWAKTAAITGVSFGRRLDRIRKGIDVIDVSDISDLYRHLTSHWRPNENPVIGVDRYFDFGKELSAIDRLSPERWMMNLDAVNYLPDDILVKVDRAAMSASLETRAPFLDPRVIEGASRLPGELLFGARGGKQVLRQILDDYVPSRIIDRPKMGFGVPLGEWLAGPLRDWSEDLLSKESLLEHGLFREDVIRQKWSEHLSGQRNWQYHLWDVLMFQSWYRLHRAAISV